MAHDMDSSWLELFHPTLFRRKACVSAGVREIFYTSIYLGCHSIHLGLIPLFKSVYVIIDEKGTHYWNYFLENSTGNK